MKEVLRPEETDSLGAVVERRADLVRKIDVRDELDLVVVEGLRGVSGQRKELRLELLPLFDLDLVFLYGDIERIDDQRSAVSVENQRVAGLDETRGILEPDHGRHALRPGQNRRVGCPPAAVGRVTEDDPPVELRRLARSELVRNDDRRLGRIENLLPLYAEKLREDPALDVDDIRGPFLQVLVADIGQARHHPGDHFLERPGGAVALGPHERLGVLDDHHVVEYQQVGVEYPRVVLAHALLEARLDLEELFPRRCEGALELRDLGVHHVVGDAGLADAQVLIGVEDERARDDDSGRGGNPEAHHLFPALPRRLAPGVEIPRLFQLFSVHGRTHSS